MLAAFRAAVEVKDDVRYGRKPNGGYADVQAVWHRVAPNMLRKIKVFASPDSVASGL